VFPARSCVRDTASRESAVAHGEGGERKGRPSGGFRCKNRGGGRDTVSEVTEEGVPFRILRGRGSGWVVLCVCTGWMLNVTLSVVHKRWGD